MEKTEGWITISKKTGRANSGFVYRKLEITECDLDEAPFRVYVIDADAHDKEQSRCCGNCKHWFLRPIGYGECRHSGPVKGIRADSDFGCKFHEWRGDTEK